LFTIGVVSAVLVAAGVLLPPDLARLFVYVLGGGLAVLGVGLVVLGLLVLRRERKRGEA